MSEFCQINQYAREAFCPAPWEAAVMILLSPALCYCLMIHYEPKNSRMWMLSFYAGIVSMLFFLLQHTIFSIQSSRNAFLAVLSWSYWILGDLIKEYDKVDQVARNDLRNTIIYIRRAIAKIVAEKKKVKCKADQAVANGEALAKEQLRELEEKRRRLHRQAPK